MAIFVRPAVWSYDEALFRSATADEDRLEAMLAAIALPDEGLWVVESNQRPVAFAWSRTDRDTVRLIELYAEAGEVAADEVALELLQPLLAHVEREHGGKFSRLEVPAESVHGVDPESLRDAGLALVAEVWAKGLLPSD